MKTHIHIHTHIQSQYELQWKYLKACKTNLWVHSLIWLALTPLSRMGINSLKLEHWVVLLLQKTCRGRDEWEWHIIWRHDWTHYSTHRPGVDVMNKKWDSKMVKRFQWIQSGCETILWIWESAEGRGLAHEKRKIKDDLLLDYFAMNVHFIDDVCLKTGDLLSLDLKWIQEAFIFSKSLS